MPVTAKLSRKFYETFGDEIANELVEWFNAVDATYKADLRELNELNFQRFDDKLERRLRDLRAELLERLNDLRSDLLTRIAEARSELGERIAKLGADLRTEFQRDLAATKSSLLRWMFGFWIGTLAPLAGLIILLTR